eukprot:tig00000828_g4623.t1
MLSRLEDFERHHGFRPRHAFLAFKRASGSDLAQLVELFLKTHGYSAMLGGDARAVSSCACLVLVLTAARDEKGRLVGAFDAGDGDHLCRRAAAHAFAAGMAIIAVTRAPFEWPKGDGAPAELRALAAVPPLRWDPEHPAPSLAEISRRVQQAAVGRCREWRCPPELLALRPADRLPLRAPWPRVRARAPPASGGLPEEDPGRAIAEKRAELAELRARLNELRLSDLSARAERGGRTPPRRPLHAHFADGPDRLPAPEEEGCVAGVPEPEGELRGEMQSLRVTIERLRGVLATSRVGDLAPLRAELQAAWAASEDARAEAIRAQAQARILEREIGRLREEKRRLEEASAASGAGGGGSRSASCMICGGAGHFAADCPVLGGQGGSASSRGSGHGSRRRRGWSAGGHAGGGAHAGARVLPL